MQVTCVPPIVQVLSRVFDGSRINQVPSGRSIRVRPSSVSSERVRCTVQKKLAAIIEAIPVSTNPAISQGEIVSQKHLVVGNHDGEATQALPWSSVTHLTEVSDGTAIARTPDISPTFILSKRGKPYAVESIGNMFREAAIEAGMTARLHGLRKAFCVYWAEQGKTVHQIAAMAGHVTLTEVERYTRAADREQIVRLIMQGA